MSLVSAWGRRGEAQDPVVVAHPSKPCDRADPCPCERRDVQTVARVVLEVVEVDERGLRKVVVGQLEVANLRGDDRLCAGRERGVAHCQPLVVGEVSRLLLVAERVAA